MTLPRSIGLLLLLATTAPAFAADPPALTPRVDRLEKELRAVQRKVFPGGSPAFFEPEIAAPAASVSAGSPASQPLAELSQRVDGLERELSRITSQLEQSEHRLSLLSEQAAKDRATFEGRLKTLEATGVVPAAAMDATATTDQPSVRLPAKKPSNTAKPATAEVEPAPEKSVSVSATASGDPAEDAYMEGYRLWEEKRYPEAQAVLAKMAKQYPKSRRASYARAT